MIIYKCNTRNNYLQWNDIKANHKFSYYYGLASN